MNPSRFETIDAALLANVAADPGRMVAQDVRGGLDAARLAGSAWMLGQKIAAMTPAPSVAICLPSINEYVISVFACAFAGKTAVPVNFLLQPREMAHIFKDSGAGMVITSSHFAEKLAPLGMPMLKIEDLANAPKPTGPVSPKAAARPAEVAVLLYTSGTTALPKGVMLTHGNLLHQLESLGGAFDLRQFHLLSALPLFHTFALTCCVLLPSITPARVSLLPQFDPHHVLESMPKFGANVLLGVPSMFRMMGKIAKRHGMDATSLGLTLAVAGGEKLPVEVAKEWEATIGVPLLEGFGMTEHAPTISVNLPHDNVTGTIGKPIPGVEWRVVGPDGSVLGPGQEGELQIRSKCVMAGYHNTQPELQPFTRDGWLMSGDLAVLDTDGRGRITGRIKELIISAGKNINPLEIEDVAMGFGPALSECAAIGIPDRTHGETPALFLVAAEGQTVDAESVRAHLHRELADYKMPRHITVVESLPHTPTGKVFRRGLKAMLESGQLTM
jgi:long-chain acyl-CoA synthetase